MSEIKIGSRRIGKGHPAYLIAEMSANHNQDFDQALRILQAAKKAGADAVKVQTYTADTMTLDSNQKDFVIEGTLWEGRKLYELYEEAHTPWEWQGKLQKAAIDLGLDFFSTAFDDTAVDFLEQLNVPVHKIASFEIVDIPLIRKMASTGKPLIISTGMSTQAEIEEALQTARLAGAKEIVLLKCTSAYPAPPESMNLNSIPYFEKLFSVPIGLSDHTLGITVPIAAVALGACIIEKHFTLSREHHGPDSAFSLEPQEFLEMSKAVRISEAALGQPHFGSGDAESKSQVFRRSLFVSKDIKKGDIFTRENLRVIRPGFGLHSRHFEEILGQQANRDISRGTPMKTDFIKS